MGRLTDDLTEITLAEIDENKAFTNAFRMIDCIATVSEFDIWTPYSTEGALCAPGTNEGEHIYIH